jgi:hypothetical protein
MDSWEGERLEGREIKVEAKGLLGGYTPMKL